MCTPSATCGPRRSRIAETRALTSSGRRAPALSITYTPWAPAEAMIAACSARPAGSVRWGIIRSPCTSRSRSRASAMCCTDTSASVQCVAMRTRRAPSPAARRRWSFVPMPGTSVTARRARETTMRRRRSAPRRCAARAELQRRAAQPISMPDADRVHPGGIEPGGDRPDLLRREAVADRVRAVAESRVEYPDLTRRHAGMKAARARSCVQLRGSSGVRASYIPIAPESTTPKCIQADATVSRWPRGRSRIRPMSSGCSTAIALASGGREASFPPRRWCSTDGPSDATSPSSSSGS